MHALRATSGSLCIKQPLFHVSVVQAVGTTGQPCANMSVFFNIYNTFSCNPTPCTVGHLKSKFIIRLL